MLGAFDLNPRRPVARFVWVRNPNSKPFFMTTHPYNFISPQGEDAPLNWGNKLRIIKTNVHQFMLIKKNLLTLIF